MAAQGERLFVSIETGRSIGVADTVTGLLVNVAQGEVRFRCVLESEYRFVGYGVGDLQRYGTSGSRRNEVSNWRRARTVVVRDRWELS